MCGYIIGKKDKLIFINLVFYKMVSEFLKKCKIFFFVVFVYWICVIVLEIKCVFVNFLRFMYKFVFGRMLVFGGRSIFFV